jgi:alkylhydroperoxidase/carboxymuconolactone decarboxylase family protein YurZ
MDVAEKAALKDRIIRARGYWARFHDVLLEREPRFLEAYLAFQSGPTDSGVLPRKLCEFVYIAIDLSVNHMYERGARRHMEHALKAGATPEEVLQVILLTTVLAARQPIDLGLKVLTEEVPGIPPGSGSARLMTDVDPALGATYRDYAAAAERGPLSAKERELVSLAVCAAPTALYEDGIRQHVRGALAQGATPREIHAVLQLSAALSIHTCTIGIPGYQDVLDGKFVE